MSSYSYIALSTNHEQRARNNEKEKRLSPSEWLLNSRNDIKKKHALHGDCPFNSFSFIGICYKSNTCQSC